MTDLESPQYRSAHTRNLDLKLHSWRLCVHRIFLTLSSLFLLACVAAHVDFPSVSPVATASIPGAQNGEHDLPAAVVSEIDSTVRAFVDNGDLPALAAGVWAKGRPIYMRGHGMAHIDAAVAASESTPFRIGSIAKQMTAAAVMRLEAQGRLSLSDPISRFIDDAPAHWEPVTLHHLLTHTGGMPSYTDRQEWRERHSEKLSVDDLIAIFRDLPLTFEPGTSWAYSNSGYLLLGPVIERASGRSYSEYVTEELAAPLGLRETGPCDERRAGMAVGYRPGAEGFIPAASNQIGGPFADGDLCSSVRDLLRWTNALSEGRVVSAESWSRMTSRARLDDGREIHYGYGFDLLHLEGVGEVVEHGGGVPGFRSHLAYYPEQDVAIVVLTNRGTDTAQMVKEAIARHLFADLLPRTVDLALPPGQIAVYVGSYDLYLAPSNQGPFTMGIFEREGRMFAEVEKNEIPLLWQGQHEFVDGLELGLRLRFEVEGGRAVKLISERSGLKFEGTRLE
jgi:D-alanyl-D-alanine carboxypeptidase